MIQKDLDELLNSWMVGFHKVFTIIEYVADPDIIVLKRTTLEKFDCDEARSTTTVGPFTLQELTKLLKSDIVKPMKGASLVINYKEERRKGCECGAWATNNPECHAFYCKNYRD